MTPGSLQRNGIMCGSFFIRTVICALFLSSATLVWAQDNGQEDIESDQTQEVTEAPEAPEVQEAQQEEQQQDDEESAEMDQPDATVEFDNPEVFVNEPPAQPQPVIPSASPMVESLPPLTRSTECLTPLDGNQTLLLNFRDASVATILDYISEAAGLVVLQDARVDGQVTLISRQPVTVNEAVDLLNSVLKHRGYAAIRINRLLKIVPLEQAMRELVPIRSGNDPSRIPQTDAIITQVIPIRHADATRLRQDLASLVPAGADLTANAASNSLILTTTEAGVRRIVEIIRAIDIHMSEVTQVKVFQLKYANAANAARLILEIFRDDEDASAASRVRQMRRAFIAARNRDSNNDEGSAPSPKVTASADDRTNTLVVSATPEVLTIIEELVKELDSDPAEEQAVFVYHVRNGQAKNLELVINSLFGWNTGTGATSTRNVGTTTTGLRNTSRSGATGTTRGTSRSTRGGSTTRGNRAGDTSRSSRTTTRTTTRQGSTGTTRTPSAATVAAASDLTGQVYVVADEDTNTLLVSTASTYFDRVKEILDDLDRPVPQVLIKVLLAEVTHKNTLDLGAEFSVLNLRAGGMGQTVGTSFGVAAASGGLVVKLLEQDVAATIRALATTTKLDVLSRPYILTSDNQPASILVGQEVPFITNTRLTDTGQTINTITYDDIGIILEVTPHINPDGLVTLDVYPEISTLTGDTVPISETLSAPVFAKRSAQSRVAIRDGQTIVIGGLMEDRITDAVNKVPLLGDIPLLGAAFRRTIKEKSKTELLIFLTPHVAQAPANLQGMSEDELKGGTAVQDAVSKGALQEHLRGMQRGAPNMAIEPEELGEAQ